MTHTVITCGLGDAELIAQGYFAGAARPPQPFFPPIVQGFLHGPIITQGYAPAPVGPVYPIDPSVITQGILGAGPAVLVQGYHLQSSAAAFPLFLDLIADSIAITADPFAIGCETTVSSTVPASDPFAIEPQYATRL